MQVQEKGQGTKHIGKAVHEVDVKSGVLSYMNLSKSESLHP